jgi:hypothetical protein
MVGKCSMSNACLWLKGAVCAVLKGIFAIWTGGKDTIYSMMRPKFNLEDLEREDESHQREGSEESEQERLSRNLRAVLREEMETAFVGFEEEIPRFRQSIVNATKYKDLTQASLMPNLDLKDEVEDDVTLKDDEQIGEMNEAADDVEVRNERYVEMEPGFSGTRNHAGEDIIGPCEFHH